MKENRKSYSYNPCQDPDNPLLPEEDNDGKNNVKLFSSAPVLRGKIESYVHVHISQGSLLYQSSRLIKKGKL